MKAAIENFADMDGKNKWLILGDMRELGQYEVEEHRNILNLIAEKKFQNVILVGEVFKRAVAEAGSITFKPILYKDSDELVARLKAQPLDKTPSLILVKGSRGISLEKAVEFL
jgi:UDP-N-acetylmuramoyl-tripeptide--D-alanyl-D-alanine ligase